MSIIVEKQPDDTYVECPVCESLQDRHACELGTVVGTDTTHYRCHYCGIQWHGGNGADVGPSVTVRPNVRA